MKNYQYIHQNSLYTDYYTPKIFTDFARQVMGSIDFDPASSDIANAGIGDLFGVGAKTYLTAPKSHFYHHMVGMGGSSMPVFSHETSGHKKEWHGNVWMNHPFGRDEAACSQGCTKKGCLDRGWHTSTPIAGNKEWIQTAVNKYKTGEIDQLMLICFAALSADWFSPLLEYPMLIPGGGRVNYYVINSGEARLKRGSTKDSVLFYLGSNRNLFRELGSKIGTVYEWCCDETSLF